MAGILTISTTKSEFFECNNREAMKGQAPLKTYHHDIQCLLSILSLWGGGGIIWSSTVWCKYINAFKLQPRTYLIKSFPAHLYFYSSAPPVICRVFEDRMILAQTLLSAVNMQITLSCGNDVHIEQPLDITLLLCRLWSQTMAILSNLILSRQNLA